MMMDCGEGTCVYYVCITVQLRHLMGAWDLCPQTKRATQTESTLLVGQSLPAITAHHNLPCVPPSVVRHISGSLLPPLRHRSGSAGAGEGPEEPRGDDLREPEVPDPCGESVEESRRFRILMVGAWTRASGSGSLWLDGMYFACG